MKSVHLPCFIVDWKEAEWQCMCIFTTFNGKVTSSYEIQSHTCKGLHLSDTSIGVRPMPSQEGNTRPGNCRCVKGRKINTWIISFPLSYQGVPLIFEHLLAHSKQSNWNSAFCLERNTRGALEISWFCYKNNLLSVLDINIYSGRVHRQQEVSAPIAWLRGSIMLFIFLDNSLPLIFMLSGEACLESMSPQHNSVVPCWFRIFSSALHASIKKSPSSSTQAQTHAFGPSLRWLQLYTLFKTCNETCWRQPILSVGQYYYLLLLFPIPVLGGVDSSSSLSPNTAPKRISNHRIVWVLKDL